MNLLSRHGATLLAPFFSLAVQIYAQGSPAITSVSGGVGNPAVNTVIAPGEIITILGSDLAQASANMGTQFPTTIAGVMVTIGGQAAPLFMVSPGKIVAQVPFEVPTGA